MKKTLFAMVAAALLVLSTGAARAAIMLDFDPTSQHVDGGDSVSVDITISGLTAGSAPSVGAFDLDVSFDSSILSPTAVTFGALLGDVSVFEAITGVAFLPGVVDLFEVSLLFDFELDALQPAAFVLATITFDAIGGGTSPLGFSEAIVSDAVGNSLTVTSGTGAIVVPEPGPFALFALGLGLIGLMGARKRTRRA